MRKLYEDYAAEVLSEENYKAFLISCQNEQTEIKERLAAINGELDKTDDYAEQMRKLQAIAAYYVNHTELTAEMLNKLIKRIEVKHVERSNGKKKQEITIIYRFINTTLN